MIKLNKLIPVLVITVAFFLVVIPVCALSSDFYQDALNFYQENCNKNNVLPKNAVLCYLFDKATEIDAQVVTLNSDINNIKSRVTVLEAKPTPSASTNLLHAYDKNGNKIGIVLYREEDKYIFFNEELNKIIITTPPVNMEFSVRPLHYSGNVYQIIYTEANCQGKAYVENRNDFITKYYDYLLKFDTGKYYVLDQNAAPQNISGLSYFNYDLVQQRFVCVSNNIDGSNYLPMAGVSLPFPETINLPLQFRID